MTYACRPSSEFKLNAKLSDCLRVLFVPSSRNTGRTLFNRAERRFDLTHGGTWVATNHGPAIYNHAFTHLGGRVFPIAGAEAPFSIWVRLVVTGSDRLSSCDWANGMDGAWGRHC